jgi:hypothetical protein
MGAEIVRFLECFSGHTSSLPVIGRNPWVCASMPSVTFGRRFAHRLIVYSRHDVENPAGVGNGLGIIANGAGKCHQGFVPQPRFKWSAHWLCLRGEIRLFFQFNKGVRLLPGASAVIGQGARRESSENKQVRGRNT